MSVKPGGVLVTIVFAFLTIAMIANQDWIKTAVCGFVTFMCALWTLVPIPSSKRPADEEVTLLLVVEVKAIPVSAADISRLRVQPDILDMGSLAKIVHAAIWHKVIDTLREMRYRGVKVEVLVQVGGLLNDPHTINLDLNKFPNTYQPIGLPDHRDG